MHRSQSARRTQLATHTHRDHTVGTTDVRSTLGLFLPSKIGTVQCNRQRPTALRSELFMNSFLFSSASLTELQLQLGFNGDPFSAFPRTFGPPQCVWPS